MKRDFANTEHLLQRLQEMGIESNQIPGFMKDLANSLFLDSATTYSQVNKRLHSLGWNEIELDYRTFELARECLGKE